MQRFLRTLILSLVIIGGGWLLYHRHQINSIADAFQLVQSQLGLETQEPDNPYSLARTSSFYQRRTDAPAVRNFSSIPIRKGRPDSRIDSRWHGVPALGETIRIASFKLDPSSATGNLSLTAEICGAYDVVAIQNSSSLSISRLVQELNGRGFDFRFADQTGSNQQFAIIFNQQSVMLEEQHWYTVNDPEDLFLHDPLVAWFRARNAPPQLAFTFTLANLQLNPRRPDQEIAWLGELFRSIRNDGRNEDDIILAGDFSSSDAQLKELPSTVGLKMAIVNTATNTRNDSQLDNIIFDEKATVEFTGECGTFDFMKRFNLTLVEALSISNRMPVWAEFSVLEGHSPGRAEVLYQGLNVDR